MVRFKFIIYNITSDKGAQKNVFLMQQNFKHLTAQSGIIETNHLFPIKNAQPVHIVKVIENLIVLF